MSGSFPDRARERGFKQGQKRDFVRAFLQSVLLADEDKEIGRNSIVKMIRTVSAGEYELLKQVLKDQSGEETDRMVFELWIPYLEQILTSLKFMKKEKEGDRDEKTLLPDQI